MTDRSLVEALVMVELTWYAVLAEAGIAPKVDLPSRRVLVAFCYDELARQGPAIEAGGNPVIPLLAFMRAQLEPTAPEVARWLHKGLTSQDALDTAMMMVLQEACVEVLDRLDTQAQLLSGLAHQHRRTLTAGRTLTQHAVPTTFGLQAANWLNGVLDVADDLWVLAVTQPIQVGGAAGTLAAIATLAAGDEDPEARAVALAGKLATGLNLHQSSPWHTNRRSVTRIGDVLVAAVDAWSHIANDVLVRARPEIGELSEGAEAGRGGSSTMPHKQNPILSVLIRRAGLTAPQLGATLHTAAAAAVDERPDGGWHAEWTALRSLTRLAVVAAQQTVELLDGLVVHEERMRQTAEGAADDLLAERRSIEKLITMESTSSDRLESYLGANDRLINAAVERAERFVKGRSE